MPISDQPSSDRHSLAEHVLHLVSLETDTDPLELPQLYDTIDPDALEAFIDGLDEGMVQFHYAGQVVTIQSSGIITVSDRAHGAAESMDVETDDRVTSG